MNHSDRLVDIFLQLVEIDAISKKEKPVAQFIKTFFENLNIKTSEDQAGKIVNGNTGNIIAKITNGIEENPIAFTAHMDTIKSTQNIKTIIENGIIKTDGSTILGADNRAGIAIILYSIEKILKEKIPFRPFEAVFTIGEETGLYGAENLDLNIVKSRIAYTLDSSADPGCYVLKSPTAYDFNIVLIGKPSHAAVNPSAGINAISMVGLLLNDISVGQVDDETTLNFGKIAGGEANNVIPPKVEISGEVRSFNNSRIDYYLKKINECLEKIKLESNGNYTFSYKEAFSGFDIEKNEPAIYELNSALQCHNLIPKPLKYHGASDANTLNRRGVLTIDVGIGAKNPHSTDEYIKIEDMKKMAAVMMHLVKRQ